MKYRKSVFIVSYRFENNKLKYLILKRHLHWNGWEFPKGGIEGKESAIQIVKREIKEETGQITQNIKSYPLSGKYKYKKILQDRPGIIGQSFKLFSAELKKEKVKVDKQEHLNYNWVTFSQAIKRLTYSNQRRCLRIVNRELTKNTSIK